MELERYEYKACPMCQGTLRIGIFAEAYRDGADVVGDAYVEIEPAQLRLPLEVEDVPGC